MCKECGAIWKMASKTAHCTKCHLTFSTPGLFDKHLKGYRDSRNEYRAKCLDPKTMTSFTSTVNTYGTNVYHGLPRE